MATGHAFIDPVIRRATHRLPRSEQARIRALCIEAVGEHSNPGEACHIAGEIASKESAIWLERNRQHDADRAEQVRGGAAAFARQMETLVAAETEPTQETRAPNGLLPSDKCAHGVYVPEWYCQLCRAGHESEPEYGNPYVVEIRKAISPARRYLRGPEGEKDFEDLSQLAEIEVWRAAKKKGAKMNEKIAYQVARNVRGKFLADRIERMSPAAYDHKGSPILDENDEPKRVHLVSLNRHRQDDDGNETADKEVEVALADSSLSPETLAQAQEEREHICAIAQSFHGLMREVAEAMLVTPDFNLDVPAFCRARGRAQRTVYRAYQAVRQAFRAALQKTDDADEKK